MKHLQLTLNKMKTRSLLLAVALCMSLSAFAQKLTFKGIVVDDQGIPVIGATIMQKGVTGARNHHRCRWQLYHTSRQ